MNGFHDAANSIATVVSTGVLKPAQAVLFAAFFNLVAIFVFHLSVAATVGKGIVAAGRGRHARGVRRAGRRHHLELPHLVLRHPQQLLACADRRHRRRGDRQGGRRRADRRGHLEDGALHLRLAAARLPARLADDGAGGQRFPARHAVARGQVVPPAAAGFGRRLQPGPRRQRRAEDHRHHLDAADRHRLRRRRRQGAARLGDHQLLRGHRGAAPCSAAGASSRPWARRSPSCKPVGGFCAETGGALTLFLATALGIPVSTTHTITGAIVGVGSTQRASAVRWGVAGNIVWAWIFTIPASRPSSRRSPTGSACRSSELATAACARRLTARSCGPLRPGTRSSAGS